MCKFVLSLHLAYAQPHISYKFFFLENTMLKKCVTILCSTLALACSFALPATASPETPTVREAVKHLENREYDKAAAILEPLSTTDTDAQFLLGLQYASGMGKTKDEKKAADLIEAAALKGHPNAQSQMALFYMNGQGRPQDYEKALAFVQQAIAQKVPEAYNTLGVMHYFGHGLPQNLDTAKDLFRESANLGVGLACYHLGAMYEAGQGGPTDLVQAEYWYTKGAALQNQDCVESLASLKAAKK